MRKLAVFLAWVVAGCGGGGGRSDSGSDVPDAVPDVPDSAGHVPDAVPDVPDSAGHVPDAVPDVPDAAPDTPDATPTWTGMDHVHIYIDNFCNTSAVPAELTVPAGETLQLTWHNHSVDYDADVWLSYGGGYLGLPTGATWSDPFEFCSSPGPYEAGGDVSIAGGPSSGCPGFTVHIHCL